MMKLMTVKDLARESQLSVNWWRKFIKEGGVPIVRLGRRVRVVEGDYRELIEQNRIQANQGDSPDVL